MKYLHIVLHSDLSPFRRRATNLSFKAADIVVKGTIPRPPITLGSAIDFHATRGFFALPELAAPHRKSRQISSKKEKVMFIVRAWQLQVVYYRRVGVVVKSIEKGRDGNQVEQQQLERMVVPRKLLNVTVPSYFMCPISLDLMRDPVTLCTGMTYDRSSIEKWLDEGNLTCPATMQLLDNTRLIPNHTLRRLIQEWCVSNRSNGVERIPTPKVPAQPEEVRAMLEDLRAGINVHDTVTRLRTLVRESDKNRRCAADAGAIQALVDLLNRPLETSNWEEEEERVTTDGSSLVAADREWIELMEDILATIVLISNNEAFRGPLVAGLKQLACICWFLKRGSIESKVAAAVVLESLATGSDSRSSLTELEGVTESLVGLLGEKYYPKAVFASLKCLLALCATRKNRIRAVEAGVVPALVEFLPEAETRGMLERALKILELLSSCAEGREAISDHALVIPMLVKLILRASETSTEHAVVILWMVCEYSVNAATVRDAAVQAGAFTRLLLLLQTECSKRTKQKAVELLKHLRDIWSQYPCSPGKKALSQIGQF
ncbi:hypothetical protein R1sor_010369 [Riccia sorocarpa]|uniref:RING-type E3 ubiquitin transferase n=1 Tax=Riccia sorocarpa TaxID=122646 RepID=A0ABD3HY31_9MARC